jgi:hypothetical protein
MRIHIFVIILSFLSSLAFPVLLQTDFKEVMIDDSKLYCGDLHTHQFTLFPPFISPLDIIFEAKRKGLDFLAITDHNSVEGSLLTRWVNDLVGSEILIISGEEITIPEWHINAINISTTIPPAFSIEETINLIHLQGGLAIGNHPEEKYQPSLLKAFEDGLLDGVEYITSTGSEKGKREVKEFLNILEKKGILEGIIKIGVSDTEYTLSTLGDARTCILADRLSVESVLGSLRDGRYAIGYEGRFLATQLAEDLNRREDAVEKLKIDTPYALIVGSYLIYIFFLISFFFGKIRIGR